MRAEPSAPGPRWTVPPRTTTTPSTSARRSGRSRRRACWQRATAAAAAAASVGAGGAGLGEGGGPVAAAGPRFLVAAAAAARFPVAAAAARGAGRPLPLAGAGPVGVRGAAGAVVAPRGEALAAVAGLDEAGLDGDLPAAAGLDEAAGADAGVVDDVDGHSTLPPATSLPLIHFTWLLYPDVTLYNVCAIGKWGGHGSSGWGWLAAELARVQGPNPLHRQSQPPHRSPPNSSLIPGPGLPGPQRW